MRLPNLLPSFNLPGPMRCNPTSKAPEYDVYLFSDQFFASISNPSTLDALESAVLYQGERRTLSDLRVMVHPGARGFLRNIGAEACFGF